MKGQTRALCIPIPLQHYAVVEAANSFILLCAGFLLVLLPNPSPGWSELVTCILRTVLCTRRIT
jgi:hypothetical protein